MMTPSKANPKDEEKEAHVETVYNHAKMPGDEGGGGPGLLPESPNHH
jgi:hypothetical protein